MVWVFFSDKAMEEKSLFTMSKYMQQLKGTVCGIELNTTTVHYYPSNFEHAIMFVHVVYYQYKHVGKLKVVSESKES